MQQDTDMATAVLGLDGVEVVAVDAEADGGVTVWVTTADERAFLCPGCGTSGSVKGQVTTAPGDVGQDGRRIGVVWVKHRRICRVACCPVKTFTESLPQVPPRCRLTVRLREHAAHLVAEGGMSIEQAARRAGVSWPTVHDSFAAATDPVLEAPLGRMAHLGIDEHRRGRPRWATDEDTGEYRVLADRWHTCFFDLSGDQGLLGQVEGRTAD